MSIRSHTVYNLIGNTVPLVTSLITIPLFLGLIGEARYGVLLVAWILLGYFGFFDLGLSRATAHFMAKLRNKPGQEKETLLWTVLLLNIVLGLTGALVLFVVGNIIFTHVVSIDAPLSREILSALPWLACALPLTIISASLTGALQGLERFLPLNITNLIGSTLSQILPLIVAWQYSHELGPLILAVLFSRLLSSLILFLFCQYYVPLKHRVKIELQLIPILFRYGGWVAVSSVIGPLLSTLDRLLIGAIAGPKAVTYYGVPFSIVSRVMVIPTSLSSAIFPRYASEEANQAGLTVNAVNSLIVAMFPLVLLGIMFMNPFLSVWISTEFAEQASAVGEIILLGLWANAMAYVPHTYLQGSGSPEVVAKFHLLELVPYIIMLMVALHYWGIIGAALAWTTRVYADAILLFWASNSSIKSLKPLLLPSLIILASALFVFTYSWGTNIRTLVTCLLILFIPVWIWKFAPISLIGLMRKSL